MKNLKLKVGVKLNNQYKLSYFSYLPRVIMNLIFRMLGIIIKKRFFFKLYNFNFIYSFTFEDIIGRYLRIFGSWEPFQTTLMKNSINNGDVAIDVGAHHGYYSILMSQMVGNNGKVYAFEPSRENARILKAHLQMNSIANVQVFKCALGNNDSESIGFNSNFSRNSGSYSLSKENNKGNEIVKLRKLDNFIEIDFSKVKILKIDVEGFENEVLSGAFSALSKLKKGSLIFLEISSPHGKTLNELIPILRNINYLFTINLLPTDYSAKVFFKNSFKTFPINFYKTKLYGDTSDIYLEVK